MDLSKKTKKILIFSLAYFPNVGGAEVAIKEITDRVLDAEFDLVSFNLNGNSAAFEKIGNVNVYRVGGVKALYPILAFWKAYSLNRKNKYSLVWSMMAAYAGFAGLFFKSVFPKTPFLLTLQEGDSESHILKRVGVLYPLWSNIFKGANYIQAISNYLADFGKKYGARCPIEIIPNGVDIKNFQTIKVEPEITKKELGLKTGDKILVTVSRLVIKNGVGDIIEAIAVLPENVMLLVLGIGPLEEELKTKIKKLGLEDRVKMLGHIDHSDLPKYLHASDVFIRPSLSEGLGNVFLEAMAAGLPVVGTNVGGIPDFLKDGETGLFCEVSNFKSIAEKVMLLINNDELRNKIIDNGNKLVQEKYDWNLIAEKMKIIFNKLCAY